MTNIVKRGITNVERSILDSLQFSSKIIVEPSITNDIEGVSYIDLIDAVNYAEVNATSTDPLLIEITSSITISNNITLTNPYVAIRGIGTYNIVINVDDSLAGGDIFNLNYPSVQTTAPLGNFQLVGSSTLKSTANTKAINVEGQGVMYLNTLRLQSFNEGLRLDRTSGTTQIILLEDNITIRDCTTGVYIDNSSATFAKLISVDGTTHLDVRTNANLTIESGSASGFLNSQTDTGMTTTGSPNITLNNFEFSNLLTGIVFETPTILFNGCNFDDTIGNEVLTQFIVNGAANIRAIGTRIDTSKIQFNTALGDFEGNFINRKLNDKSFWVVDKLNVGLPNEPREAAFGGGNSYNLASLIFEFDGSTYTNVKDDLLVEGDGNDWSFSNLNTNTAIYFSNTHILPFFGLKINVTTATVLGAGDLVFEYWDGVSWSEVNWMVTKSSDDYLPFGNDRLTTVNNFQIRFDDRITEDWVTNDPITSGTNRYWIRLRISSSITTSPTFDLVKIHSNRVEFNEDGFIEFFGTSRSVKEFPIGFGNFAPATSSPANQDIYLSDTLFFGRNENSFQNGITDSIGTEFTVPFDMDTSCPIRVKASFSGESNIAGDVLFRLNWGYLSPGDDVYRSTGAAPSIGANEQSIELLYSYPSSSIDTFLEQELEIDLPEIVAQRSSSTGDSIVIVFSRIGGDISDTYLGDINLSNLTFRYTSWRTGGHINAQL